MEVVVVVRKLRAASTGVCCPFTSASGRSSWLLLTKQQLRHDPQKPRLRRLRLSSIQGFSLGADALHPVRSPAGREAPTQKPPAECKTLPTAPTRKSAINVSCFWFL